MTHPTHNLSTYKEGWQQVEYCTLCGSEGLDLHDPCPYQAAQKNDEQLDLFVDKTKERS